MQDKDIIERILSSPEELERLKSMLELSHETDEENRDIALLTALRPYLQPPRQQRLDDAVRAMKLLPVVGKLIMDDGR